MPGITTMPIRLPRRSTAAAVAVTAAFVALADCAANTGTDDAPVTSTAESRQRPATDGLRRNPLHL